MALNPDQERAAQEFFQFLFSPAKEFSISGPAGTGKTFLMQKLLNETLVEFYNASKLLGSETRKYEIVLCATTNKAADVLAQATGRTTATIHSHLNLVVRDNYKTGVSSVKPTNQWTVHSNQLVFVDEGSMIDKALYDFICQGFDNTCKIVYLGDHCQMAPVHEKISPIYTNPSYFVTLSQPMRNAGQPALIDLCSQLRASVETLRFQPIAEAPGVIDYVDPDAAQAFINATFAAENPDSRILCYTNRRVLDYNQYIRELRGYSDALTEGERVINNTTIPMGATILRAEEEFEVTRIDPKILDVQLPGAVMQINEIELDNGARSLKVKVPVNGDHFKALMRFYANQKDWGTYYNLKNGYPDLRPKDAATVYKAQGSTYETVFLDLTNIGSCTHNDQLARMLYVGASRATTRLVLFGKLPARLFQKAA